MEARKWGHDNTASTSVSSRTCECDGESANRVCRTDPTTRPVPRNWAVVHACLHAEWNAQYIANVSARLRPATWVCGILRSPLAGICVDSGRVLQMGFFRSIRSRLPDRSSGLVAAALAR